MLPGQAYKLYRPGHFVCLSDKHISDEEEPILFLKGILFLILSFILCGLHLDFGKVDKQMREGKSLGSSLDLNIIMRRSSFEGLVQTLILDILFINVCEKF